MTLCLNPFRVLTFLLKAIVLLSALNLIGIYFQHYTGYEEVKEHLVRLIHFDEEQNIPTLFSSMILLLSTLLITYIIILGKRQGKDIRHWVGLALIFGFLSLDEAVSLHESLIGPVRKLLNTDGLFYFAWVVPYGLLTVFLLLFYIRFLFGLSFRVRLLMISSGCIFLFGAVILEMIGGNYYSNGGGYERDLVFSLIATLEEIFEMVGVSLFIYSLLIYIKTELDEHTLKLEVKGEKLQAR